MSLAKWINEITGWHLFPTAEERVAVRASWRHAMHDHQGEATKAVGIAVHSRNNSAEAIGTLRKAAGLHGRDPVPEIELEQLRSLRAWLLARGESLKTLTNDVVDRTQK